MENELKKQTLLFNEINRIFTPELLDQWAKETNWIQRKRKIDASSFLSLLLYQKGDLAGDSLRELSLALEKNFDILISTEAINQRLNEQLVAFLQKCIEHFIKIKMHYKLPIDELLQDYCDRIRIIDATIFTLPPELKVLFPGIYRAELKCQLEFDFRTGAVLLADWLFGKDNDALYGQSRIETIKPGDLFLQDLGYFHFPTFEKMQAADAYYVSRVRPDCSVYIKNPSLRYHKDGNVIKDTAYLKESLADHLEQMERGTMKEWPIIYLGYDYKFPTRLIMYRHTEEQEKENQAKRKNTRYKTKEHVKKLDGATLIMTNLPDTIPAQKVQELYRLRWQIELLFKGWKSNFPTSFYKKIKESRVYCHFYAHLLLFLLTATTIYQARLFLLEKLNKEISIQKGISTAFHYISDIFFSIKKDTEKLNEFRFRFLQSLCRSAIKTREKPGKNLGKTLSNFSAYNILSHLIPHIR